MLSSLTLFHNPIDDVSPLPQVMPKYNWARSPSTLRFWLRMVLRKMEDGLMSEPL